MSDLDDKLHEAKLALLERILKDNERGAHPNTLLRLAEAYAWIAAPGSAHGSAADPS